MKKVKHDHKGTKLLKLGIFASLMLAPIFAVLFKCAYVTFNKNAKDSYYGETINEQKDIVINNKNQLESYNKYYLKTVSSNSQNTSIGYNTNRIYFTDIEIIDNTTSIDFSTATSIGCYKNNGTDVILYYLYDNNNTQLGSFNSATGFLQFSFNYVSNNLTDTNILTESNAVYRIEYNNYSYLDNAFYYAIDEMKNNELFNWTTNTALYTPTAAMTNGMGITTNALPILITYWIYLTAIYIVIDIVVELFTALTHMITSRFEQ